MFISQHIASTNHQLLRLEGVIPKTHNANISHALSSHHKILRASALILRRARGWCKISGLIRDQQSRNTRTRQSRQSPCDQRADRQPRNITAPTWRDLGEHTDLSAQRTDVGEATESVGGYKPRTWREVGVCGVCLKGGVGDELILRTELRGIL